MPLTFRNEIGITDLILTVSSMTAVAGLLWALYQARRQARLASYANLAAIVAVERSLRDTPTAFRFHGITEEEIQAAGLTPDELAYLTASFTAGGTYHRAIQPDERGPFPPGTYRYQMLSSPATRKAWPLVRKMMNTTPYTERVDATVRLFDMGEFTEEANPDMSENWTA